MATSDYIIIGGGIGGCVVASRLHQKYSSASILLIEAGPDVSKNPLVNSAVSTAHLQHSELDWDYKTLPQKYLGNKICFGAAGKALGGGSAINGCGWVRGDKNDYDEWAKKVGDPKWSYAGMLPYFRKTENHHLPYADPNDHGFEGGMYTCNVTSSGKNFPLRNMVKAAWEAIGLEQIPDANSGSPQGFADLTENRRNGRRQLASDVYDLKDVKVMAETLVKRVVVEQVDGKNVATGVELASGEIIMAKKEVIISAGAYRTPQVLMLSGIGPAEELKKHGIVQVVELPEVGKNLHDHLGIPQRWKLRNPERGYSLGSPLFNDPKFFIGIPMDFIATFPVPSPGLKAALEKDEGSVSDNHTLLYPPRSHLESYVVYVGANKEDPVIPLDGSHVATRVVGLLPSSRGTVTLASAKPEDDPVIDPNYYATEMDRYVIRSGLRKLWKMLRDTEEGRAFVESETTPSEFEAIGPETTDEDIDRRVRKDGDTLYHAAGTAAMGKVVDGNLKVYGVEGLRVVDASVMPVPIASHYQACIYAIGEQAADII